MFGVGAGFYPARRFTFAPLATVRRGRCLHRPAVFAPCSGRTEPSAPTTAYRTYALFSHCHSEPVTDVTGVGIRFSFSCLRRPLFFQQRKKRGKETPPKTTFLDFLTRLHPPLITLDLPRERCAMQISSKCCIASASLFAAAFALKCKAVQCCISTQRHYQPAAKGRHQPLPLRGKGAI